MKRLLFLFFLIPCIVYGQNLTVNKNSGNTRTLNGTTVVDTVLAVLKGASTWTDGNIPIWDATLKKLRNGGVPAHSAVTLSAIGSSPNANGATLTAQVLNLQPASVSFGGVITTGTQSIAGAKTFTSALDVTGNIQSITSSDASILMNTTGAVGSTKPVLRYRRSGTDLWAAGVNLTAASVTEDYEVLDYGIAAGTTVFKLNRATGVPVFSQLTTNGLLTTSGGTGTVSVTAPGTGVLTALGVNVGSAGAFVVNGGALGTPSSGTATNLSGTATSLVAGSATILANTRTIFGQNFNGSANVSGALSGATTITASGNISTTAGEFSATKDQNANTRMFLTNNTDGTGAKVALAIGNSAGDLTLSTQSASYTTAYPYVQDGGTITLSAAQTGGLYIGTDSNSPVEIFTNGTPRLTVAGTGGVTASAFVSSPYYIASGAQPGVNTASRGVIDFSGGAARWYSYGTNATTTGTFQLTAIESDGGGAVNVLTLDGAGLITTTLGTGAVQSTAGVLSVTSDSKFKDVGNTWKGSALSAIMKIPLPRYWNYNRSSGLPAIAYTVDQFGLLADKVFPVLGEEFAPTQKDGSHALSDRALLSLTIQALQESNRKIDSVKTQMLLMKTVNKLK